MPLPHAPWQRYLEEVPVIGLNVKGGLLEYRRVMRLKKHRERRIGLSEFRDTPMTSKMLPEGGFTYHIIRLQDPRRGGVYVDLLICDQNQYLVTFRRRVGNVWSEWFFFKDQQEHMPRFANSRRMSFTGRHTGTTTIPIGEFAALIDIFEVLIDPASSAELVRRALLRAVIILCEATRNRLVYENMEGRMKWLVHDRALGDFLWNCIKKWKKTSKYCLYRRKKVLVEGGDGVEEMVPPPVVVQEEDAEEAELHGYLDVCQIYNLDQAIGPQGHLKLILLNEYYQQYGPDLQFPDNYVDDFRPGNV